MSSTLAELIEPRTSTSASAITRFTAGPASATASSRSGVSGMRLRLATPPIGSKVTSSVSMPKRRATRMWPNSWSVTEMKMSTMNTTLSSAARGPLDCHAANAIQARKIAKVT